MTSDVRALVYEALADYASELGDQTCDDWEWPDDMPVETRLKLVGAFHAYNGSLNDLQWFEEDMATAREGGTWSHSSLVAALAHLVHLDGVAP